MGTRINKTARLKMWSGCLFVIAMVLVVCVGWFFRAERLAQRPMHTDEAVHAVKFGRLLEHGDYRYNPYQYHGPALYYFTLIPAWLDGESTFGSLTEGTLRIVPVVFGTALILALLLCVDALGWWAVLLAGVLCAISPAMVFYSRYYIPEMLLIFWGWMLIACGWRYYCSRKMVWALLAGLSAGLMYATKETCVIAWGSMLVGFVAAVWGKRGGGETELKTETEARLRMGNGNVIAGVLAGGAVFVVTGVLFFSSFGSNMHGIIDSVWAYVLYLHRAAGETGEGYAIHNHKWYYYLKMLIYSRYAVKPIWSEGLIVGLSIMGIVVAVIKKPVVLFVRKGSENRAGIFSTICDGSTVGVSIVFLRFMAFYTLCMVVIYALIPYKTPWCLLGFLQGMIVLAGVGAVAIIKILPGRALKIIALILLLLGIYNLGWQSYRCSYVYYADTRNPYVYAHTSTDIYRLVQRIGDIGSVYSEMYNKGEVGGSNNHCGNNSNKRVKMELQVIASGDDYWPLPWYMRKFNDIAVGYYNKVPDKLSGDMIVCTMDSEKAISAKLGDGYHEEYYGLRPGVLVSVYIRNGLWRYFLRGRE